MNNTTEDEDVILGFDLLTCSSDDNVSSNNHTDFEPVLSKKDMARLQRSKEWKEKLRQKKAAKKAAAKQVTTIEPVKPVSEEVLRKRKERKAERLERYMMGMNGGHNIVIDCGFEEVMHQSELNSLCQQMMFCYGVNRRSETPASLYFTEFSNKTESMMKKMGFDTWSGVTTTPKCYTEYFNQESLVYLTADSENTITELDRSKVYVIGGIVDRNRLKQCTYLKATQQGIATAKLPLGEFIKMSKSTKVLTVNHVYEIMVRYDTCRNWKEAMCQTLPERKGIQETTL